MSFNGMCDKCKKPYQGEFCPNCEKNKIFQAALMEQHDPTRLALEGITQRKNVQPSAEASELRMQAEVFRMADHRAYVCECGSVNFHLIESGDTECAKCLKHQFEWGDK